MTDVPVVVGVVQGRCVDMEDYARIHNDGFAEAVEQFGELLNDARQDLAPGATAGELMSWLVDVVKAMNGADQRPPESVAAVIERIAEVLYDDDRSRGLPLNPSWERAYPIARRPYLELAAKVLAQTNGAKS